MSALQNTLLAVNSPDRKTQKNAEETLNAYQKANPSAYLFQLIELLADDSAHPESRQLASLLCKNLLKNVSSVPYLTDLWINTSLDQRKFIRTSALRSLSCPHRSLRNSAAQVVAAIIGIDHPRGEWLDALQILISNASNTNPDSGRPLWLL